eukprot:10592141-Prorocentrum_lima.AAC.1
MVATEDAVAGHLGWLVIAILKNVGRSMHWHTYSPGSFASLLNEQAASLTLEQMNYDWGCLEQ